ncbi:hypothetical protein ACWCPQ_03215 [Nocardia sp. NPDC001965]
MIAGFPHRAQCFVHLRRGVQDQYRAQEPARGGVRFALQAVAYVQDAVDPLTVADQQAQMPGLA